MDIFIRELTPPAFDADPGSDAWQQLVAFADLHNRDYAAVYGEGRLIDSEQQVLADWTMPGRVTTRLFLAFSTADPCIGAVGAAKLMTSRDSERQAHPFVTVPSEFRRRGVGTALADHLEALAAEGGRTSLQAWVTHEHLPGGQLAAPTGFGQVAMADPATPFLLGRGWTLGQVERISELPLPAPLGGVRDLLERARAHAGADYELLVWEGASAEEHRADLARLNGDMSLDAPAGELEFPEQEWDATRVVEMERRAFAGGSTLLNAAVRHRPSGRLVAQSLLFLGLNDPSRPAQQDNTIVVGPHRGRRLGMLVKAANLLQLVERYPACSGVFTWNAEENTHMLRVNEALGFVSIGAEGGWQKRR